LFSGGLEIGFLLFIAFLLFGPKKLPEIARVLGKGMAELRRASTELRTSLEEEIRNLDRVPEGRTEARTDELTAPTYGDHHSEPTPDDTVSRQ
jgi:TatA/E family protein of Tat protein translocase